MTETPGSGAHLSAPTVRNRRAAVDFCLIALAVAESVLSIYGDFSPLKVAAIVVAACGLPLRRRWPWLAFIATLPALVISGALFAAVVALFSVTVTDRNWWRLTAATVIVAVGSSYQWIGLESGPETALTVMYIVLSAAAPVALGLLQRARLDLRDALTELRQSHDSERAHLRTQVLAQERTRIAREMHDVVSHHVSLIAVQAGALQVAYPDSPPGETASVIRHLAGQTLAELRQMVAVLRSPSDAASSSRELSPQPGIDGLHELIATSGIPITDNLEQLPTDLSAAQQRAIYRTIQEALTNVRKHADSAPTVISVERRPGAMTITIANQARGAVGGDTNPRVGHGLIGICERAELVGGRIRVRSSAEEFAISLELPSAGQSG